MHRCLAALALAACGTTPHAAAPAAHRIDAEAAEDPLVAARAIVAALRSEDGAGLPAVVDPEVGAWFWEQPGAYAVPTWHLRRDDELSHRMWSDEVPIGELFQAFAADLERAIASHDLDPADPLDARYVGCERAPVTGYLRTRAIRLDQARWPGFHDQPEAEADAARTPIAYELHFDETWLYLSRRGERLYLAHLVHSSCDA